MRVALANCAVVRQTVQVTIAYPPLPTIPLPCPLLAYFIGVALLEGQNRATHTRGKGIVL